MSNVLPSASDFIAIAAPDIGPAEETAVLRVLRSGRLAQGPEVENLEKEFGKASGLAHVVAVTNGTAALHVALQVLGIGPGDEVLVPAFTFAASANAVLAVGASPVFVDIDDDYLIDLDDAANKVTKRTAAIMPVHLYGLMADMAKMKVFADRFGLAIVEDAAQAHLATRGGTPAGATGVGAFSLYATKNMMSGEGGFVTTMDEDTAERARLFRNHGMVTRYDHVTWGLNFRMTDLLAAIGRAQLERLGEATDLRRENAAALTNGLPGLFVTPRVPEGAHHVFHQYTVRVPARIRDKAVEMFRERSIGADIYYPTPVDRQPAFAEVESHGACPRAGLASSQVISLPVHPKVGVTGIERIVSAATEISELLG